MHALPKTIIILFASLFLLTGISVVAAHAQEEPAAEQAAPVDNSPKGLLAQLPNAGFSEKGEIADKLAHSGHPRATLVLKALVDGTLFQMPDGKIVIGPLEGEKGDYSDPLSGSPVSGINADTLDKITVNNRLRRELKGLAARLMLSSSDEDLRNDAAEEAFTARDPESLPVIETALAKEKDAGIKATLMQARAAILLADTASDDKTKLAAIATLRERGDQDALNVLMTAREGSSGAVIKAADEATKHITDVISYWSAAQNIYYGLSLGSVLLLAAIGLAITFGVMGVINMAHGEMIMIGSYTTFVVQQLIAAYAPQLFEISLLIAIPAAFLVAGGFGVVIERTIIRFLYGRPLETLLATFGLSLILQQAVRTVFGPTNREVTAPSWMSGSFEVGLLNITYSRLWILVFAMVVLAGLMAFLKRTHFGMQMRAVTQNRQMAASVGIRTDWVDALTFGLGSGIAGIAGVALSQIDNVSPNLGQSYIIDSFMVVVFGGVGNLWGTLVGAMTLGVANKFLEPYAGAVLGKILVLVFIILFIQKRPRGLFALKGRAVES